MTNAGELSPELISECGLTLRNLSPSMLQSVLRDELFVKRVPYGSIENPAAYVHSMVKKFTRYDVESKILECIGAVRQWYNRDTVATVLARSLSLSQTFDWYKDRDALHRW